MAAFYDEQGQIQQVEVSLDLVREAADNSMSVREWVNTIYPTDASAYGDAFTQLCASEGLVMQSNKRAGIRAPSLGAVLEGKPKMEATGAVVRNPSQQARVLLMPAIGALIEDKLVGDMDMHASAFDSMIALDDTIADEWMLWPEANFSKPEQGRSQVTSQLARPARMLTLTTSEKQVRIPTYALGIEWSEQATRYLNLDFVALSIARQIAVERNERAQQDLLSMLNGDIDMGQGSLASLSQGQDRGLAGRPGHLGHHSEGLDAVAVLGYRSPPHHPRRHRHPGRNGHRGPHRSPCGHQPRHHRLADQRERFGAQPDLG
jgi:hypothetical protein